MEASNMQRNKEQESLAYRPYAFNKMEGLVREMQDPENGVPVRSQKLFLTSIPSAFMGYDLIEWLMERLNIEESVDAVHIANQLCQYGYFFPVNDSRTLAVKDDSSLYRFQSSYYWPWQYRIPDNVEYAIYLAKRTLRNKQRHGLDEYEIEALNSLKKNLQNKWDVIQLQAEEQVRLSKERKKGDKIVFDSQERAFWRVYRPPPGFTSSLEILPVPTKARPGLPPALPRRRTLIHLQREVDLLRNSVVRTRVKASVAIENLKTHFETYLEYDPIMIQPQPSNPWITDDQTFWQMNSSLVEIPNKKRVKRWALSMEELMSDPTGLQEFTNYLRKEYSHENIRFWLAVKDLKHSNQTKINDKAIEIFREFLSPGAPCEINIDGKTMEKIHQEINFPTRFMFDAAADHVYTLLLKKDCYPRFIRSDHYRNLLLAGVQPLQKKRFFGFVGQGKKKVSSSTISISGGLSQQQSQQQNQQQRRRGSDRSLCGSAHELAVCGVRDTCMTPQLPHSHSQSNLNDIPYRGDLDFPMNIPLGPNRFNIQDVGIVKAAVRPINDVCPWDMIPTAPLDEKIRSAETDLPFSGPSVCSIQNNRQQNVQVSSKNFSHLDFCSSLSNVSIAVEEVSEKLRNTSRIAENPKECEPHEQIGKNRCIPIHRNHSLASVQRSNTSTKIKFADTARATISNCTFSSPQHSVDLSYVALVPTAICDHQRLQHQSLNAIELPRSRSFTIISEKHESHESRPMVKAPVISISTIVGDLLKDSESSIEPGERTITQTSNTNSDCALMSEPLTQALSIFDVKENKSEEKSDFTKEEKFEFLRSTRVKHSNQNIKESRVHGAAAIAPESLVCQQQRDNNIHEVCPWEDEENCKVDAPYVKTYATLGYL